MNKLFLIIKREFITKVRNKTFIVMTFLSPLLFVLFAALVGFLISMNKDEADKIVIHDEAGILTKSLKSNKETTYKDLSKMPFKAAKDTASKSYDGMIYVPKTNNVQELKDKVQFFSEEDASTEYLVRIESKLDSILTQENLKANNLDINKINSSKVDATLKLSKYSGETALKGMDLIKIILGFAFGYLIFMFIIIFGNYVMRSVIEEKTNRIIEVVISSVKPFQLMMGKIIGNALAGLLQFAVWGIVAFVLYMIVGSFIGAGDTAELMQNKKAVALATQNLDLMGKVKLYLNEAKNLPILTILVSFIFYFIGGYFLYSSIYAAIGAAVDNETDSQQFLVPIMMPLIIGIYVGFITVSKDPHGNIATIFSMIPFTSPIVMLMRIPFGVPAWQIILSILILFATFFFIVWFAAKIYRVGILMYGKKPTWKELFKWMRYAN